MRFISQGHRIPIPGKRQAENNENRYNNGWDSFRGGNLTCRKLTPVQGVKDQRAQASFPPISQISRRGMMFRVILSPGESFCLPGIQQSRNRENEKPRGAQQGDADLSGNPVPLGFLESSAISAPSALSCPCRCHDSAKFTRNQSLPSAYCN